MNDLIDKAVDLLKEGAVIGFPTETVYGLGADAMNPSAVACIFELKNRPSFNPLIVHIGNRSELHALVSGPLPTLAHKLIQAFWPGPLTLVLPKKSTVPDLVTAGLDTVAVRMPSHPVALELLNRLERPIAAPSANRSGGVSPTHAQHVRKDFGNRLFVLDGGPCKLGIESTVISFKGDSPLCLRLGSLSLGQIELETGKTILFSQDNALRSPGQLLKHYAPKTPLFLLEEGCHFGRADYSKSGLLCLCKPKHSPRFAHIEELSSKRDLRTAATHLFSALRKLDSFQLKAIFAIRFPEEGLGLAMNDRLRRAAYSIQEVVREQPYFRREGAGGVGGRN